MVSENLLSAIAAGADGEVVTALLSLPGIRVERILSTGQASPPDFWYDQPWVEWVLLLSGSAALRFDDDPLPTVMKPGDYVLIPAHRRHRVDWTDPEEATVWLAIHCDDTGNAQPAG